MDASRLSVVLNNLMGLSRSLVVCDIQPRYSGGVTFDLRDFVAYIKKFDKVLYLFNNKDIGVPETEDDVIKMLKDQGGATDEDLSKVQFRPKVYYYFRDILDDPRTNYEECKKLLKMLILKGVNNAYELESEAIRKCLSNPKLINDIKRGKLHFYYDPMLAADLCHYENCEEVGGFENQCNIEINLYMDALDLFYTKNYDFIF